MQTPTDTLILPPRGDRVIELRLSRNTVVAICLSIIVHLIFMLAFNPKLLTLEKPADSQPVPINVVLNPAADKKPAAPEFVPPPPPPPVAVKPIRKLEPARQKPEVRTAEPKAPPVMAATQPSPLPSPTPTPPASLREPAPATDMMSYVNAARERRLANEGYTARDYSELIAQQQRRPTEDEIREANIKRNLQQSTNGFFQVIRKGSRSAQFYFYVRQGDFSNPRKELIGVEAGYDGDIDRAIAKKLIELIRQNYPDDFTYESMVLGHTVRLSARQNDLPGLEDFFVKEIIWVTSNLPRY